MSERFWRWVHDEAEAFWHWVYYRKIAPVKKETGVWHYSVCYINREGQLIQYDGTRSFVVAELLNAAIRVQDSTLTERTSSKEPNQKSVKGE